MVRACVIAAIEDLGHQRLPLSQAPAGSGLTDFRWRAAAPYERSALRGADSRNKLLAQRIQIRFERRIRHYRIRTAAHWICDLPIVGEAHSQPIWSKREVSVVGDARIEACCEGRAIYWVLERVPNAAIRGQDLCLGRGGEHGEPSCWVFEQTGEGYRNTGRDLEGDSEPAVAVCSTGEELGIGYERTHHDAAGRHEARCWIHAVDTRVRRV